MDYDLKKVEAYAEETGELAPLQFKMLYIWLTECLDWAGHPRDVPTHLIVKFGTMSLWERANVIDRMRKQLFDHSHNDFQRFVKDAREWDYSQEMVSKGWWKDEQGRWRSPLDDPNCPFALESDEHPK